MQQRKTVEQNLGLFETGRHVYLRAPTLDDRQEFIALIHQSWHFLSPWVLPPFNAKTFREFVKRSDQPDYQSFFICRKQDGVILGVINMSQIFRGFFQSAFLGYYIGAAYTNQGYMTEALQLVLRHAFVKMKLHRLEANIQPENIASIRLVQRCGFHKEGYSPRYLKINNRWRDHERWAILKETWKQNKS